MDCDRGHKECLLLLVVLDLFMDFLSDSIVDSIDGSNWRGIQAVIGII